MHHDVKMLLMKNQVDPNISKEFSKKKKKKFWIGR